MSGFDWFKYHPAKFAHDLWQLTPEQFAVLLLLAGEAYQRDDCTIPSDPEWIRRLVGYRYPTLRHHKRYHSTLDPVLKEYFSEPHEGRMTCLWLYDQFMEAAELSQDRTDAARCRWEKVNRNNGAMHAPALQLVSTSNAPAMRGEESRGEERDKRRLEYGAKAPVDFADDEFDDVV